MKRSLLGLFALPLVLVACTSGPGDAGSSEADACGKYFDALSSYGERCSQPLVPPAAAADQRARFQMVCEKAFAAPGATQIRSFVESCAARIQAASCGDEDALECEPPTGTLADGAACAEDYQCASGFCKTSESSGSSSGPRCGTCAARVPVGGECTSSSECATGSSCAKKDAGVKGTCVAEKVLGAGDVCFDVASSGTTGKCDKGLRCKLEGSTGKCAPPGAAGEACTSRFDCADDLRCVDRKCGAPQAEGQACTLGGCAAGFECDATKKCARVVYVKGGEECDDAVRRCERGHCSGGGFTQDGPLVGKCVDPLPDGAACTERSADDDSAPRCDVFADCIDGKCAVEDPASCK